MIIDLLTDLKIVRKFLKDWQKLHKLAYSDTDNRQLQDQSTLALAKLWHNLTERQKSMVFAGEKDQERIDWLTRIEKYSVEQWETMLNYFGQFKDEEEYKKATVQQPKPVSQKPVGA